MVVYNQLLFSSFFILWAFFATILVFLQLPRSKNKIFIISKLKSIFSNLVLGTFFQIKNYNKNLLIFDFDFGKLSTQ